MKFTLCVQSRRYELLVFVIFSTTLVFWNLARPIWDENKRLGISGITSVTSHQSNLTDESQPWESGGEQAMKFLRDDSTNVTSEPVNMTAITNAVRNDSECLAVAADPRSFWRSQPYINITFTANLDYYRMTVSLRCGLLYPEYMNTPPMTILYPFERYYLSEPPLHNVTQLSSEKLSVVTLLSSRAHFRVGENVTIRIDTKDGKGRPKVKGGDDIRVWFKDSKSNAFMAAEVTDLNNGTYLATARLLWAGQLRVHTSIAYHREYLRAIVQLHRVIKSFHPIVAEFNNPTANEMTPCYHTPLVLGNNESELCNFTEINGSPWFCGRPVKSQLSCNDLAGTRVMRTLGHFPVTDPEMILLLRSCIEPRIRYNLTELHITVLPGVANTTVFKPALPCHKIPANSTWTLQAPRGFLLNNTWHPSFCHIQSWKQRDCFKNRRIYVLGDSNGRNHYFEVVKRAKCKEIKKALTYNWHSPLLCVHRGNNFTLSWDPHSNPFMGGNYLSNVGSLIPSTYAIDRIPAKGRHLVVLNHFIHMTAVHTSVTEYKLGGIRDALKRLFQRNPDVQVIFQGPHIAWKGWPEHFTAGDMLGPHIMALQLEIFKDILDRVVYFSPWDMTIAAANQDYHPGIAPLMTQTILGFMCGR